MRLSVICLFLSALVLTAGGQTSKQLLSQIQKSKADTGRIKLLLALSKQILLKSGANDKDIDSSTSFMKQAERLSKQLNHTKSRGDVMLMEALISNKKGDVKRGLELSQKALKLFTSINDLGDEAEAWIIIGQHYGDKGKEMEQKMACYKKAIDNFKLAGAKERQATTLTDLADFEQVAGNYEESIRNLYAALGIYQSIGYRDLQGLYDLLGSDLDVLGDKANALKYQLRALKLVLAKKDTSLQLCTIYNRIGITYRSLGDWKQALSFFDKALTIAHKYNDSSSIVIVTFCKANAFYLMNQPVKALQLFKSLAGISLFDTDVEAKVEINHYFVLLYLQLKQYGQAQQCLKKIQPVTNISSLLRSLVLESSIRYCLATKQYRQCYKYLKENEALQQKRKVVKFLSDNQLYWFKADSGLGKFNTAVVHYQRYKLLADSNFTLAKNKQAALLQIEFDTEKKDQDLKMQGQEIQLLNKQSELRQIKYLQAKTSRNMMIGGSAMLLVLLGLGYNRFRIKQQSNLQLQLKQEEINDQNIELHHLVTDMDTLLTEKDSLLKEKDWLLKEVHHRVKNNLQIVISLLNTQSAYLENSAALTAIRESQNRVQAISLIHQKLYSTSNVACIDMQAYICDMINYLRDCFDNGDRQVRFEKLVEPIKLDLSQAIPLGLILNEAVTNAIKYAFDGKGGEVIIALQLIGADTALLTIADNGKGLPANFDIKQATSLGMEMMKALSKQLGGIFNIKNKQGTTITIEFVVEKVLQNSPVENLYI